MSAKLELVFLSGEREGQSVTITDAATLGQSRDAQVVVPDPIASDHHARVWLQDGRIVDPPTIW